MLMRLVLAAIASIANLLFANDYFTAVLKSLNEHRDDVASCNDVAIKKNPKLNGYIDFTFSVTEAGKAFQPSVKANTVGDKALGVCLVDKLKGWTFPKPPGGRVTKIQSFPINFGDGKFAGPEILSGLSKEAISAVAQNHRSEIRACYNDLLTRLPNASGTVTVSFTISPEGKIANAGVKENTLRDKPLEVCIIDAIKTWIFPKPPSPVVTEVTAFPFHLNPK